MIILVSCLKGVVVIQDGGIAMNQSIRWNEVSLVSFCGPVDGLKHTLPYLIVVF